MLKHGILGLLNYSNMTGYEIREVFRDSLNFFWTAQTSQIYRELQTLSKNGWVTGTTVVQTGKPDKIVYSITDAGKAELLRWLSESETGLSARIPVLMRVFFFGERSKEENLAYFKRLQEECRQYLAAMEPIGESVQLYSQMLDAPQKAEYWQMTADFGKRTMQMYIDWAQACIDRLEGTK